MKTVKCPRCKRRFASHGTPEQTGDCKGRVFQCPDCGRVFNRRVASHAVHAYAERDGIDLDATTAIAAFR